MHDLTDIFFLMVDILIEKFSLLAVQEWSGLSCASRLHKKGRMWDMAKIL
jgi:hypothetical protein